jgi:hypothetical protein
VASFWVLQKISVNMRLQGSWPFCKRMFTTEVTTLSPWHPKSAKPSGTTGARTQPKQQTQTGKEGISVSRKLMNAISACHQGASIA